MDDIVLRIDGKVAKGKQGDTILEVCKKNGIDVPTLCHFEGLPNAGSCRLCIVEIEGMRGVNTACTTPATNGMVVRTDTEALNALRVDTLQLLFAERNHFCMFCEISGDCELQAMAYRFKIDHFVYPFLYPKLTSDTSNPYFVLDHSRCVLCTRCVRACSAMAGANTLGASQRSSRSMISADIDSPLGESSCTSCGACVQICPTGALFEKGSAYRGHREDCDVAKSVCPSCSVGCGVDVVTRANNPVTVEGDFSSDVNKGLLCVKGRFQSLNGHHDRITEPMVRKNGELQPVGWDEALNLVASKLKAAGSSAIGVASARMSNENLYALRKLFREVVGSEQLFALDSEVAAAQNEVVAQLLGEKAVANVEASMSEMADADCFLVVGVDPRKGFGVVDSFIRRSATGQTATVIVIDSEANGLASLADVVVKPKQGAAGTIVNGMMSVIAREKGKDVAGLEKYTPAIVSSMADVPAAAIVEAAKAYAEAKRPMIIYGKGAVSAEDAKTAISLASLALLSENLAGNKLRLVSLREKANSRGALDVGFAASANIPSGRVSFLMAGDDLVEVAPTWLADASFAIVQASYPSALTAKADVVLPFPTWFENEGSFTSNEGRIRRFGRVIEPPAGSKEGWEVFSSLAAKMTPAKVNYHSAEEVYTDITRFVPGYEGEWVVTASAGRLSSSPVVCVDYL